MSSCLIHLAATLALFAGAGILGDTTLGQDVANDSAPRKPPPDKPDLAQGDGRDVNKGDKAIIFREDRQGSQSIARAAKLIADENWAAAGTLLVDVLARDSDAFLRPTISNPATGITAEARRLIAALPKAGRDAYRLRVATESRRALDRAVDRGSVGDLARVMRRFPHTLAAYDATFLLGRRHLDGGRPQLAAAYLRGIAADSVARRRFEPQLSIMLVVCLIQSGETEAAKQIIAELSRWHPDSIRMAGNASQTYDANSILGLLTTRLTPQQRARGAWRGFRGGPRRLATTSGEGPLMRPEWVCRFGPWLEDEAALEHVRQMRADLHDRNIAVLPSVYPLAVGGQVVFRVGPSVVCVDAESGKIRWTAGLSAAIGKPSRAPLPSGETDSASMANDLATRSWGDALAGRLSTDGALVFAIEGMTKPRRDRSASIFGSTVAVDATSSRRSNTLVALDLNAEGRRRWTIDGSQQIASFDSAGTFFLGCPLPLGGRLYTVAEQNHKIRLLVFDASNGDLIWSLHLADLDPLQALSALQRVYGVTPSYTDGVLVCPTSAGAVVLVDLATQSLRAGYKLTDPHQRFDASLARGIAGAALLRAMQQQESHERHSNGWWDENAIIADRHVLFTSPSDQKLRCLRLSDGKLVWMYPPSPSIGAARDPNSVVVERDPLYVGGVVGKHVLVVCRSRVVALQLDDGQPAWQGRDIALPAGGVAPSGRGLVGDNHFFLPLSNGQIATIDVDRGQLMHLAGTVGEAAPGNLIADGDHIFSLGLEQMTCYRKLQSASDRLVSTAKRAPHDLNSLLDRAELLRLRNRRDDGIALLSDAQRVSHDPKLRSALKRAMLEVAEHDPAQLSELDTRISQLIESPHSRWRLLATRSKSARTRGDAAGEFATLLKMCDLRDANSSSLSGMLHTSNAISIDRKQWLQRELQRSLASASAGQSQGIEKQIKGALQFAFEQAAPSAVKGFIDRFRWHPLAATAISRHTDALVAAGEFLQAEHELVSQTRFGDARIAAAATLRLARLYRSRSHLPAAAEKYSELAKRYGDVVLPDGRTGKQHVHELAADDPVRSVIVRNAGWPAGTPSATNTENGEPTEENSLTIPMRPSLVVQGPMSLALARRTLHYYYNDRTIAAHDRFGHLLWKAKIDPSVQLRINFVPSIPLSYAQVREHLVLVSLGNALLAIDCLNVDAEQQARVIWHRDLSDAMLSASNAVLLNRRWLRMRLGAQWGGGALAFGRLATTDVAMTEDAVFFTHHRSLHAVDALTGRTIWKRRNVVSDSVLLADRDHVVVMPPNAKRALVVRAADGVALGYRDVPDEASRLATIGSSLLTWTATDEAVTLAMVDSWKESTVWSRHFHPQSVASLVGDQWVSVMQPDGQWLMLRCDDGSVVLKRKLAAISGLDQMYVFRDDNRTYVAASSPLPPDSPLLIQVTMAGRKNPFVNGNVYAIDNASGELVWTTPVSGHGLMLDQPFDLPVIAFASSVYNRDEARRYSRVMCLDRRSGTVICDERGTSSAFNRVELTGDPSKPSVRIRSATRTIEMLWKE